MTIMHHPNAETLGAFAAGTLDEARALVVATHLSFCPQCQRARAAFEHVGGALLETAPTADMSAGAFDRALAQLPSVEESAARAPVARSFGAANFPRRSITTP